MATQLELVEVQMPKKWKCPKACTGYIEWNPGDMPECNRCHAVYWFTTRPDAPCEEDDDAKTIADLQGKVNDKNEFILRLEAEKGALWTRVADLEKCVFAAASERDKAIKMHNDVDMEGSKLRETITALEAEVGNLQADLAFVKSDSRSELKTLSETIARQTREIGVVREDRDRIDATCGHAITAMESADKRLAELKAAPAPPADSREAFEACAGARNTDRRRDGGYIYDDTTDAYNTWLAALAWERSRKPGKIAEAKHDVGECWRLEVCGIPVKFRLSHADAHGEAHIINAAYEKENTDGD